MKIKRVLILSIAVFILGCLTGGWAIVILKRNGRAEDIKPFFLMTPRIKNGTNYLILLNLFQVG